MCEVCLTPPMEAVLEAVRDGALAWSSSQELAEATGLELELVQETVAELISDGLIVAWDHWYTLSLECAESLGVHIEDFGIVGRGRWVARDTRSWRRPPLELEDLDQAEAEDLEDPGPDPAAAAEAIEYVEGILSKYFKRKRPLACDGIEPPTLIQTGPAIVWREAKSPATCWRCGGQNLRPWAYCLCCCRWGMDEFVRMGKRKRRA